MKQNGISFEQIKLCTGLSDEEIQNLQRDVSRGVACAPQTVLLKIPTYILGTDDTENTVKKTVESV